MAETLRILDSAGQEIIAAIDDQPLRIEIELEVDPSSAPDTITVDVIGPDGTKRPLEAERIDWGAERPLYRSELTTIDEVFSQPLESLDFLLHHAPPLVGNGDVARFEFVDLSSGVQTFDSTIDARYHFTELEVADQIEEATNQGIRYTEALRELRGTPDSEERTRLEELLEQRLRQVRDRLSVLERARKALNNPDYWAEQQIRVARHLLQFDSTRDIINVRSVAEAAQETVAGHIVSGMKDLTIGGYQMLVQSTGVAQVRTLLWGENELGKTVSWDGRAVAFLDLLGDGLLQGASMKFEMDNLVGTPTRRPVAPDGRTRYTGPDPHKNAPSGAIVDPGQMGMRPEAIRAAHRAARATNTHLLIRPTTPWAIGHRRAGAHPKPEELKSKTVDEYDTLLGMDPDSQGLVGFFDPKTDFFESGLRTSGMAQAEIGVQIESLKAGNIIDPPAGYASPELWTKTAERFKQRAEEYNGSTGEATRKLETAGKVRIENGVIINSATGKPYTGDHDPYDFVHATGRSVSPELYERIVLMLRNSDFEAQHGAHWWWNPKRSDFAEGISGTEKFKTARGIYETIINKHKDSEILIVFSPVGPPTAIFSQGAPGEYFGTIPGPFTPAMPGSSLLLPSELRLLGISSTTVQEVLRDISVIEWADAEAEFRLSLTQAPSGEESFAEVDMSPELRPTAHHLSPTPPIDNSTDDFDQIERDAARQAGQLDTDLTETDYDPFEESDEPDADFRPEPHHLSPTPPIDNSSDDLQTEAVQLGALLGSDESEETARRAGLFGMPTLAAIAAAIVAFFVWLSLPWGGLTDTTTDPSPTEAVVDSAPAVVEATVGTESEVPDPVEEEAVPLSAIPDCPAGLTPDERGDAGDSSSGGDATQTEDAKGSDVTCFGTSEGSLVFTMIVDGDGRAMAESDSTKWYNPRFIINNDPATNYFFDESGFAVDVRLSAGEPDVTIMDGDFGELEGETTVEWLDESTLQVMVTGLTEFSEVVNARVELSVRTQDESGATQATFGDDAHWNPDG